MDFAFLAIPDAVLICALRGGQTALAADTASVIAAADSPGEDPVWP
jgi:hypothetical protein